VAPKIPEAPEVSVIETDFKSDRSTRVDEVKLTTDGLSITVSSEQWEAQVSFGSLYGFRVLDELDLTEFWSQYPLANGWLFEVISGGWKVLELSRPSFISGRQSWVREYLIIGLDECVSVLSKEAPAIVAAQPSNISFQGTPASGRP
jgi:hypothetical protein